MTLCQRLTERPPPPPITANTATILPNTAGLRLHLQQTPSSRSSTYNKSNLDLLFNPKTHTARHLTYSYNETSLTMEPLTLQEFAALDPPEVFLEHCFWTCCRCFTDGNHMPVEPAIQVCRNDGDRPCSRGYGRQGVHVGPCQWCVIWMPRFLLLACMRAVEIDGYGV